MKKIILFIILIFTSSGAFSQTACRLLSKTETENLSNEIENIPYPIYKGTKYGIRTKKCSLDDCRTFKKDESIKIVQKKNTNLSGQIIR